MMKLLLPIDETTRSLEAISHTKDRYSSAECEIVLLMVDERIDYTAGKKDVDASLAELDSKLDLIKESLDGYTVTRITDIGKAGQKIVKWARKLGADRIVMTRSSRDDRVNALGKTAEYVVINAPCDVLIVSESRSSSHEYRGLVYRKAASTVNLRGQLSLKQSECLIPSVSTNCIYHIEVIRGRIRFSHMSYNPETGNWDLEPRSGQPAVYEIIAGESIDIPVQADSTEGKADRIRIINRNMKTEAVFRYRITADHTVVLGSAAIDN